MMAGTRKQYLHSKPGRRYKVFITSGISGIVYDFLLYGGESTFLNKKFSEVEKNMFGLGGKVVFTLCRSIKSEPTAVYFDNFFHII